jgi:formylglycine-generating enzyme required for sulfatase activity
MKTLVTILALLGAWGFSPSAFGDTPLLMEKDPVEMVNIPAGPFIRGSAPGEGRLDEQPQRKIYVNSFAIDKYEVSNAHYRAFLEETLHKPPFNVYGSGPLASEEGINDLPVVQVTWHDAVDYCFWAGKRLPTEAEWEKAARGNDNRIYPWGNEAPTGERVQFEGEWDGKNTLKKVKSFPEGQSSSGVFQLSGNVREWTQDWYDAEYYPNAPDKNPRGPETGILKVIRGGSWRSFDTDLRVTSRGKGGFALKTHGIGFRCARDIGSPTGQPTKTGN